MQIHMSFWKVCITSLLYSQNVAVGAAMLEATLVGNVVILGPFFLNFD